MAVRASPEIRGNVGEFPGFRMHEVFSLIPNAKNSEEWTWSRADFMDYRLLMGDSSILDQQAGPANMRVMDIREVIREKSARHKERVLAHNTRLEESILGLSLHYAAVSSGTQAERNTSIPIVKQKTFEISELRSAVPVDHSLQVWKLEYFQKFAIPFACLPFVVLAFPLGLAAKRSGRAVGFFIGLLLTTLYWSLLVLGRSLGLRTDISPFLVMVVPDLLLLAAGVILYFRRSLV